jgi:DNA-binding IclR family transcriptional regulator
MNRFYYATVIAVFVTVYLGTNLLLTGVSGWTSSSFIARPGARLRRLSRRLKHAVDFGVADMLARRERHVTLYALHAAGRHAVDGRLR